MSKAEQWRVARTSRSTARFEVVLSALWESLKCTWSAECFIYVDLCQSQLLGMVTVCVAGSVWSVRKDSDQLLQTVANLMLPVVVTAQWHLTASALWHLTVSVLWHLTASVLWHLTASVLWHLAALGLSASVHMVSSIVRCISSVAPNNLSPVAPSSLRPVNFNSHGE